MLFNKYPIYNVQENQKQQLRKKILSLEQNYLLNTSEEDVANWVVGEISLDVPEIDESAIHVEHDEKQIDVSRDPMRVFVDRSEPFYVPGTELTFIVPFQGDGSVLDVQPQGFMWSSGGSRAEVVGQEIHFAFKGEHLNGAAAKTSFVNDLQMLKQNLHNLKRDSDNFIKEMGVLARQLIRDRRTKLLADAKIVADLGFPIRKRGGAPATYAVPVQKRKPKIERPLATEKNFRPEPSLAVEEYENILNIMSNMVRVMEQSPRAFKNMGEEDLRTQFLVQLNGQYEGRASGETFNFQGKTDILIRAEEGGNVFVAECKFWAGEKQFTETIDQLLSYLTWRDTKTAVLIFNRNVNFTDVLTKIEAVTPTHRCFKRKLTGNGESIFRYVFHNESDVNRELLMTVLAFDIPRESSPRERLA